MSVHIYLFFSVILLGVFFHKFENTPRTRKQYIISFLSLLVGESCLRGLTVGSDTIVYYWLFDKYRYIEWNELFQRFGMRYLKNELTSDIGFYIYMKLFHVISHNFSLFLFVSALFFFIPFGILLYRYTNNLMQLTFIFVLYIALFHMIAMSGIRKEIALGFSIWAFLYYIDKKYIYSIIILLLGATIHQSILLVLLVPIIASLQPKMILISHIIAFLLIPISLFFSSQIIINMANLSMNEHYLGYGLQEVQGGATTFLVLIEFVSLFCLVFLYHRLFQDEDLEFRKFYAMLPLFTFFAPLIHHTGSLIRISQYFHLYILLLIPFSINEISQDKKIRNIIYIIMIIFLFLLTLSNLNFKYHFIWQENINNIEYMQL